MADAAGLTPAAPSGIETAKATMRAAALARRAGQDAAACGAALAGHVLGCCPPRPGAIVAGFWPLPGEIDLLVLLNGLARNFDICLPVTPPHGQALTFRRWHPGAPMTPGRFNTQHPNGAELIPDYILAPLLAFDRHGHRLGYGGGYYDHTFAALPNAFRLGCAFATQEFAKIPTTPTDLPLHAIATERGVRWFQVSKARGALPPWTPH